MAEVTIQDCIKDLTLGDHPEFVPVIAKILGVEKYLDYYLEREPKKRDVYHNHTHTFNMMLNVYEGICNSGVHVDESDIRHLVLAALFHDINHTCGKAIDKENVKIAVKQFTKAFELIESKPDVEQKTLSEVTRLIRATEYPYRRALNDYLVPIIRDADMSIVYITDKDVQLELTTGLINEVNYRRVVIQDMDVIDEEEFLNGQKVFWQNVSWRSRWGKMKSVKRNYPKLLQELFETTRRAYQ